MFCRYLKVLYITRLYVYIIINIERSRSTINSARNNEKKPTRILCCINYVNSVFFHVNHYCVVIYQQKIDPLYVQGTVNYIVCVYRAERSIQGRLSEPQVDHGDNPRQNNTWGPRSKPVASIMMQIAYCPGVGLDGQTEYSK